MRPKRQLTAVLLMAACAAVGCTKRETPSTKSTESRDLGAGETCGGRERAPVACRHR
jgi:hypothetical protein